MSVVTVQVGQCGNQLGGEFFTTLDQEARAGPEDLRSSISETFFRASRASDAAGGSTAPPLTARAVLVDMEPKVVASTMKECGGAQWGYSRQRWFAQQSGSGNNWAHGFHSHGPRWKDDVCELVRREVEECDHMGGFLLLQSMAGGTGSGFGACVAEALRDEYPSSSMMNHCVWPYEGGEVIVQNYNTLLTLSNLMRSSDGLVVVPNEALHATCAKLLNLPRPTFADLNRVAARAMAGSLIPSFHRASAPYHAVPAAAVPPWPGSGGRKGGGDAAATGLGPRVRLLSGITEHMCAHAGYKLLSLRAVPQIPAKSVEFTTFSWASTLKRLNQMLATGRHIEEGMDWSVRSSGVRCLGNMLTLRGKGAADADVSLFSRPELYPPWVVRPLSVCAHPAQQGGCEMSATLLSNCQTAAPPLERMLERAGEMFASRAYLHQYSEHGMAEEDFRSAFALVEEAAARYRAL